MLGFGDIYFFSLCQNTKSDMSKKEIAGKLHPFIIKCCTFNVLLTLMIYQIMISYIFTILQH